jgi:hypothetical protein
LQLRTLRQVSEATRESANGVTLDRIKHVNGDDVFWEWLHRAHVAEIRRAGNGGTHFVGVGIADVALQEIALRKQLDALRVVARGSARSSRSVWRMPTSSYGSRLQCHVVRFRTTVLCGKGAAGARAFCEPATSP